MGRGFTLELSNFWTGGRIADNPNIFSDFRDNRK